MPQARKPIDASSRCLFAGRVVPVAAVSCDPCAVAGMDEPPGFAGGEASLRADPFRDKVEEP